MLMAQTCVNSSHIYHIRRIVSSGSRIENFPRNMACPRLCMCTKQIIWESTSRTQLLRISMKSDETSIAYLTRARILQQPRPTSGNLLKTRILSFWLSPAYVKSITGWSHLACSFPPIAFNELYDMLSDHEYLVYKPNSALSYLP